MIDMFQDKIRLVSLESEVFLRNTISRKILKNTRIDRENILGSKQVSVYDDAINKDGNLIKEVINTKLNTSTKQILGDFTFGSSGAIKMITDANNGLWISPTGILGKKAGVTTFSIDTHGNAVFGGDIAAESIVTGNISIARISANTANAVNSGRIRINANRINISGTTVFASGWNTATNVGNLAIKNKAEATDLGTTVISGGKIVTGLLTASNITTGSLNAIDIIGCTITGGVFRTAVSGKSIRMTDEGHFAHRLEYRDSLNNHRIWLYLAADNNFRIEGGSTTDIDIRSRDIKIYADRNLQLGGGQEWLRISTKTVGTASAASIDFVGHITPFHSGIWDLGTSSRRWDDIWTEKLNASQSVIFGSTLSVASTATFNSWVNLEHTVPQTNNAWDLGWSDKKWRNFNRINEFGCDLPTTNCACDVIKKLKKPTVNIPNNRKHYGDRQYFDRDDFPEEMKAMNTILKAGIIRKEKAFIEKEDYEPKLDIEMTRVAGITLQAVREILDRLEVLEKSVIIK